MKSFEISVPSVNSVHYVKNITCLVLTPDKITPDTSFALFTHGWSGNRFQHKDKMEFSCEKENRICLSAEFRMSGYDFDPITGWGSYVPYDASFLQVFDVLNCLRKAYELYPECDRKRTCHYGGSQGGWIALLSAIYAPKTFAAVYASSPVVRLTDTTIGWAGREFGEYEIALRDVLRHVDKINSPLFIEHGTGDETVPHDQHTLKLEELLKASGKKHKVVYYPGGGHNLQPTIDKMTAFERMAPDFFSCPPLEDEDDFSAGRRVEIPCGDRKLIINWDKPTESLELFCWEKEQ